MDRSRLPSFRISRSKLSGDFIFEAVVGSFALGIIILAILLFRELFIESQLSRDAFGTGFLTGSVWDPVKEVFGALPFIFGTLVSSFLALLIAVPFSLGIAIFLSELAPEKLRTPLSFIIELLAAVPSVIIGLWGIFILAPFIHDYLAPPLSTYLGFLPLFQGPMYGPSMLTGGMILAIMIIPITSSVSKEVLMTVPTQQREAAIALGATGWETTRIAVLPYARSGIFGAVILGFGRAIGETMAVTMVIGNSHHIKASLFAPSDTMASVIANELMEAPSKLYVSSLIEIGFLLLVISVIINIAARILVWKFDESNDIHLFRRIRQMLNVEGGERA
ncbi:MAG: phosphate ABC transporter permease subunit PstC [Candidatus Methanoperedens sp.]|nr:phosphate ABC transporter permease subunit PstC [Candidatus Methanoperedens sp.]MCZ7369559.1 phosphate ABC transporter permease subunit PstC [Candidatus Methanoperedens sp.]